MKQADSNTIQPDETIKTPVTQVKYDADAELERSFPVSTS